MPEPRSAVMILVDAWWEDQSGTLQMARARMENTSTLGACIRLKTRIEVGTKLRIQGRWQEFCGVAKYCRGDGKEFLVGIQREAGKGSIPKRQVLQDEPELESVRISEAAAAKARMDSWAKRQERKQRAFAGPMRNVENEVIAKIAPAPSELLVSGVESADEPASRESVDGSPHRETDIFRWLELRAKKFLKGTEAGTGQERTNMERKWLDMGSWGELKDAPKENGGTGNGAGEKDKSAPSMTPPFAKDRPRVSVIAEDAGYQGELLPLDEIYRTAGIASPRGGYSIVKIAEMLHSEHLRGLARDMRRASVMMALDAAGVPINEVLRDAKARMEAIEAYEAEQRKLCEAEWARKEEENIQIRAELERVKAQYIARINRNLEAVAREKARFAAWQTTNQQEAQGISDAAELCLKPAAAEPPSAPAPQPPAPTLTSTPSPTTSQSKAVVKVV